MAIAANRNEGTERQPPAFRRFGTEADASNLSGFSKRTLQKDRLSGRNRFPWYRVGGKVLYDLNEIEQIIVNTRQTGGFETSNKLHSGTQPEVGWPTTGAAA
jgi:hypothetical protein